MAITRLGVCGPAAAYLGFTAKEEPEVVIPSVGAATLSTSAAAARLNTHAAGATLATDAGTATLEHDNVE